MGRVPMHSLWTAPPPHRIGPARTFARFRSRFRRWLGPTPFAQALALRLGNPPDKFRLRLLLLRKLPFSLAGTWGDHRLRLVERGDLLFGLAPPPVLLCPAVGIGELAPLILHLPGGLLLFGVALLLLPFG